MPTTPQSEAGDRDEVRDALGALAQDVVGHAEGLEHRGLLLGEVEQAVVGDHDERVDVLIETPFGAVAFAELRRAVGLNPRPAMVLRTPQGPRLVTDPWEEP